MSLSASLIICRIPSKRHPEQHSIGRQDRG